MSDPMGKLVEETFYLYNFELASQSPDAAILIQVRHRFSLTVSNDSMNGLGSSLTPPLTTNVLKIKQPDIVIHVQFS